MPFPIPLGRAGGGGIGTIIVLVIVYLLFLKGGGGDGGFNVPDPTSAFPQVPQTEPERLTPGEPGRQREAGEVRLHRAGRHRGRVDRPLFKQGGATAYHGRSSSVPRPVRSGCGPPARRWGRSTARRPEGLHRSRLLRRLRRRFGAPGDFAQAYVIAHEIGHHVQKLSASSRRSRRSARTRSDANELSVRARAPGRLPRRRLGASTPQRESSSRGDVEEGLGAAAASATTASRSAGPGRPETFTHGSSEQRVRWFRRGLPQAGTSPATPSPGASSELRS